MKTLKTTLWLSTGLFGLFALVAVPASADQVILDDLIVDGSICAGLDCVNGESFGFDTLRLKENNLRIKADDTSNSASFPRRDWQITFNESSNGGLEKFSIEDIDAGRTPFTIEGAADAHSIYVDTGGRIGFGTSNPVVELHVVDGDTPTLRLEQDGSSGFTPQTWDVAGNETNFFVRDATGGSTLPFRIRPTAPSNSIFVNTNGDIGMGTSSPGTDLHVLKSGSAITPSQADTVAVLQNNSAAGSNAMFQMVSGATGQMQINFGDSTTNTQGRIIYRNSQDDLRFFTDDTLRVTISSAGLVTTTTAGTCNPGPCDGVFSPEYEVESIDDHSDYMWANQHLWGVGPTPEGAPINLTNKVTGILHELEKAHIYIEQLHKRLSQLEAQTEEE